MWRFWPAVFRYGVRVWQEARALPLPTRAVGSAFETRHGKFKFVDPQLCLFRWRMGWFSFDVHTPFQIKGSVRWNGSQATVEGRIPVFTTLFMAAWLVGCTVGGATMTLQPEGLVGGLGFLLLGWSFGALMCFIAVPFEVRRAKRILSEYEAHVTAPSLTSAWSRPA